MATREEIEALAKKPYEELTSEERRLVNLSKGFFEKGHSRGGKKKGCRNWATIFQKLMGDENFLHSIVSSLPKDWTDVVADTPADVIAAALIANVVRETAKCAQSDKPMSKDVRQAIALLNKIGYGDKIVHEDESGVFEKTTLNFRVVPPTVKRDDEGVDE